MKVDSSRKGEERFSTLKMIVEGFGNDKSTWTGLAGEKIPSKP
jgi:hypothetical protein